MQQHLLLPARQFLLDKAMELEQVTRACGAATCDVDTAQLTALEELLDAQRALERPTAAVALLPGVQARPSPSPGPHRPSPDTSAVVTPSARPSPQHPALSIGRQEPSPVEVLSPPSEGRFLSADWRSMRVTSPLTPVSVSPRRYHSVT